MCAQAIQARLDFMQNFVKDVRNRRSGPVNLYVVAVYSLILADKEVEHFGLSAQLDSLIQSLVDLPHCLPGLWCTLSA